MITNGKDRSFCDLNVTLNCSYNGCLNLLFVREDNDDHTAVYINVDPGGLDNLRPFLQSYEPEDEEMVIRLSNQHEEEIKNLQTLTVSVGGEVVGGVVVGAKTVTFIFTIVPAMHDHKEITIMAKKILR